MRLLPAGWKARWTQEPLAVICGEEARVHDCLWGLPESLWPDFCFALYSLWDSVPTYPKTYNGVAACFLG
jgi:hypothetical protein